ncbi:phosphoglycolate phosphatase [Spirochaetia bacterium]|nr:phosphoglycolate phosphatase [Spirochaetia bacterium]
MEKRFDAVAFDLDGTLYPNYQLNIRLFPFLIREARLLIALGKARDRLRDGVDAYGAAEQPGGNFYDAQARIMGELLHADQTVVKERTERLIYRGWEPIFKRVPLFPAVIETLAAFREKGLTLGLLSDFPPENKLINLGLGGLWDVVLCSETTGRIKPDPRPFLALAEKMDLPPERILYVGNSVSYDIIGAKKTGMKAALISSLSRKNRRKNGNADFVFSDYRQLHTYVLN